MKLLEDMPSAVAHRPPQKRVMAVLASVVVVLFIAAVIGAFLLLKGGGPDDPAGAEDSTDLALSDWTETASQTCTTVATEHPVLTQPRVAAADISAMDSGMTALASAIREQPLPATEGDTAQIAPVVALGDKAELAWQTVASAGTAATAEQLTEATGQKTAFVNGLIELGADCSAAIG